MVLLLLAVLDGTIESQLRALEADAIERRRAAVEALVLLGEAALEPVREARGEAVDDETRSLLADIEGRIERDVRRRTFPGGTEVLGLKAALRVRWDADRDETVFALEIMNVDARERACVEPDGWDVKLPRWSWGTNRNRQRLEIRAIRVDDPKTSGGGGRRMGYGGCGHARPPLLRLEPGGVLAAELRLARGTDPRALQLRPGEYEARAVCFTKRLLTGATADLETPWTAFTVPD